MMQIGTSRYMLLALWSGVLSVAGSLAQAQDREGRPLPAEVLALPEQIAQSPDCTLQYKTWFTTDTGGMKHSRHKFVKSGVRWRADRWDQLNRLEQVASFDGEHYYSYLPQAKMLIRSVEPSLFPEELKRNRDGPVRAIFIHLAQVHWENPLYVWALGFFGGERGSRRFNMPGLGKVETWNERVADYSVEVLEATEPNRKRVRLENSEWEYQVLMQEREDGQQEVLQWIGKNNFIEKPYTPHLVESRVFVSGWHLAPVGDKAVLLPKRIVSESRIQGGAKMSGGLVIELTPGSVAPVPSDVDVNFFRVPMSSVPSPVEVTSEGVKHHRQPRR